MTTIAILSRRHLRLFWRDRLTVFFSLLGPLALFVLFTIFLRKQTANLIQKGVPGSSDADAYGMCDAWVFASVVALASFTASLGMLNGFVDDRVTSRFSDYLVAPVNRAELAISYVISTVVVSFVISTIFTGCGQIWALCFGQQMMSWRQWGLALAAILLACVIFSAMNTFIVTFLTSQGAMGGYSVTMGVATGFLAYCFVAPSTLSTTINNVLGVLPFAQTASLIRDPLMKPAANQIISVLPTVDVQNQARDAVLNSLGVTLTVDGTVLSNWLVVGILAGLSVIFGVLVSFRMGRVIH